MISQVREFVKEFLKDHPLADGASVLDIGSLDINGNIKDLFPKQKYIGLDMRPGKNVDIVLNAHDIKREFEPNSFDLVMSNETLEHDDRFWITVGNMRWLTKNKGWMLICVPSLNHAQHDHPYDYYRFFESAFRDVFFRDFINTHFETQYYFNEYNFPDEIVGYGQKP